MVKYSKTQETFTNPYHFIPLEGKCDRKNYSEYREQANLTGWIDCTLTTLTPLFIPNTSNDDFFKERVPAKEKEDEKVVKSYDFFSYTDNTQNSTPTKHPVIPGSSIRGPIRSLFEALTNSCMATIDDNHVLYKRTITPAEGCGRLSYKGGKWKIQECKKYMLKTKACSADKAPVFNIDGYEEGKTIFFKEGRIYKGLKHMPCTISNISISKSTTCPMQGYLHKGEPFGIGTRKQKHHESVFVPTGNNIIVSELSVKNLLENYKLYQDETVNLNKKQKKHKGYQSNIKNAEFKSIKDLKNGCLVYYTQIVDHNTDKKYLYLSPAAIGREVFHNRLKDIIGSYCPCTSSNEVCPACALFGFAGQGEANTKNALASRIRFSDAKPDDKSDGKKDITFLNSVILPELASPKPSATEFYLQKPGSPADVQQWNYDYITYKGKNKKIYPAEIQGRKFYWHHYPNMENFRNTKNVSERNVKVRPVDKDNEFHFKVHFNQITQEELDALLWTLALGNDKNLAHKIGMGKPVGMGSVQISIDAVKHRTLSVQNKKFYEIEDRNISQDYFTIEKLFNDETINAVKNIYNFATQQNNIKYPYCRDKKDKSYEWFVRNKLVEKDSNPMDPIISQHLDLKKPELYTIKKS